MPWVRFGAPLALLALIALAAYTGGWQAFLVVMVVCVAGYLFIGGKKALEEDAAIAARFSMENALRGANDAKKEPRAPLETGVKQEPSDPAIGAAKGESQA
ncbi:MAG: hypothetical protein LBC09_00520 [Helicobacteraceae bacterium]|jgi:hypothetical protein|nr:hypothetical protein [Helicobacteraceae bacterium]